jgi:DNA-binding transcriptional MerR regulator
MLKISEFSRLTRIPIKTLRYYDEIGLFKPAHVDRFTGYRSYSADQLPRLNRILALKGLGLSLEQIKDLLDEGLSAEQIRGMLRLKRAEIQQRLQEEQQRLLYIESVLRQIEQEQSMSSYGVVLKPIPSVRVASLQMTVPTMQQMSPMFQQALGELYGYIYQNGAQATDKPEERTISLYLDDDFTGEDMHYEVAIGIRGSLRSGERIRVYDLPAVEQAAVVVHQGSYDHLTDAYTAIMRWIDANGYEITGPSREIYLSYNPESDPSQYVTEIQFPVRKHA